MKKSKAKDLKMFQKTYQTAIIRNEELVKENLELTERLNNPYTISLKMYRDREVKLWDFSEIIKLIQFESPKLLIKLLRQIHHNYSVLNIQEMTTALNERKVFCGSYSEGIPNELYVLKTLADCIEGIKEITDLG